MPVRMAMSQGAAEEPPIAEGISLPLEPVGAEEPPLGVEEPSGALDCALAGSAQTEAASRPAVITAAAPARDEVFRMGVLSSGEVGGSRPGNAERPGHGCGLRHKVVALGKV